MVNFPQFFLNFKICKKNFFRDPPSTQRLFWSFQK